MEDIDEPYMVDPEVLRIVEMIEAVLYGELDDDCDYEPLDFDVDDYY